MGGEAVNDMETESVKSEQSSRSRRSRNHRDRTTSSHRQHSHRSTRSNKSTILNARNKSLDQDTMSPYQTTVTMVDGGLGGGAGLVGGMAGGGQEIIEVQILPQDDNWGENTTAITGNTSDQSQSMEDIIGGGGVGGVGVGGWSNELDTYHGDGNTCTYYYCCVRYINNMFTCMLSSVSVASPVLMVILPKLGLFTALSSSTLNLQQRTQLLQCNAECKGLLISLVFKLIILIIGAYMLFVRQRSYIYNTMNVGGSASGSGGALSSRGGARRGGARGAAGGVSSFIKMPYIYIYKMFVLLLVFICTFTYWLFYYIQVTEVAKSATTVSDAVDYKSLVSYATYLTDSLLFIHYLAVVLIEIKHLQPMYYIKVIRSPDGVSRSYPIGEFSIQRAAVWVLEHYYTDFPIYNPYLERIPTKSAASSHTRSAMLSSKHVTSSTTSFKFYEVDNCSSTAANQHNMLSTSAPTPNVHTTLNNCRNSVGVASSRRRDSSHHNERFYEEHEYERRVKKRKARLITAAEESFTHIKRLNHNEYMGGGGGSNVNGGGNASSQIPMDAQEAAQAIFPSMARALQKYLRVTRQQPQHTVDSILQHLSNCLKHDLTARAFLEPYLVQEPVLQNDKEQEKSVQSWALISDQLLSRSIKHNLCFQLRQNDVSLLCTVKRLPNFNLTEHIVDVKSNKFVLRLNSETSV